MCRSTPEPIGDQVKSRLLTISLLIVGDGPESIRQRFQYRQLLADTGQVKPMGSGAVNRLL
ncbi:MAG: hypothetical protein ACPG76_10900, partial [Arenicellales bacterium]